MSINDSYLGKDFSAVTIVTPSQNSSPSVTITPLNNLVNTMKSVQTNTPEAKLNSHSISDGKGGRIELDDHTKDKTIK